MIKIFMIKSVLAILLLILSGCNSPTVESPCQPGSKIFKIFSFVRFATNDPTPYCNLSFAKSSNSNGSQQPTPNLFSEIEVFDGTAKQNSGFTKTYPQIISSGRLISKKTFSFAIKNTGAGTLNISSMAITGSPFFTLLTPVPTILPNQESIIQVRYQPTALGLHNAIMTIVSNSQTNPNFTISLNGEGINSPAAETNIQVYYKFSNDLTDSSSYTRNGTLFGSISFVPDRFGNANGAASTNGLISNRVEVSSPPLFAGADNTTFAYWVRFNTNSGTLMERRNATGGNYEVTHHISPVGIFGLHGKNGTPGWSDINVGLGMASITNVPDLQKYYHVVFVKNSNITTIYIDGVQRATDNINLPSTRTDAGNNGNAIFLFYNSGGGFVGPLTGAMDSFIYLNIALTATQVQTLYNQDLD